MKKSHFLRTRRVQFLGKRDFSTATGASTQNSSSGGNDDSKNGTVFHFSKTFNLTWNGYVTDVLELPPFRKSRERMGHPQIPGRRTQFEAGDAVSITAGGVLGCLGKRCGLTPTVAVSCPDVTALCPTSN